jgi:opacity protein-like surface antigen
VNPKPVVTSLIAMMLLGFAVTAHAQMWERSRPSWGALVGLNLGKISGSVLPGETKKFDPGARVGAFVEAPFQDMFAVTAGVLFNQKGIKVDDDGSYTDQPGTASERLNFLTIPVLAKVRLTRGAETTPYIFAGPEVGIRLSAKSKFEPSTGGSNEVDIKDLTKGAEFALDLGAGIEIPFSDMFGLVQVGYEPGLTNTSNNTDPRAESEKTETLHFDVGIRF